MYNLTSPTIWWTFWIYQYILLPEKKKEFRIMIASIVAYDSNGNLAMGALTAIEGESITITVYDNDSKTPIVHLVSSSPV